MMKQTVFRQNIDPDTGQPVFPETLSPAEVQVAFELLTGEKRQTIADRLQISVSTVKKHTDRIYKKTGCGTRPEFLAKFLRKQ